METWLSWNIPLPPNVIDLWLENKNAIQTGNEPKGTWTMLNVAAHHNIDPDLRMTEEEKNFWRDKVIYQNKYDDEEWRGVLKYCEDDTILTAALLIPIKIKY